MVLRRSGWTEPRNASVRVVSCRRIGSGSVDGARVMDRLILRMSELLRNRAEDRCDGLGYSLAYRRGMAIRYRERTPGCKVTNRATEVNQLRTVSDCHRRFVRHLFQGRNVSTVTICSPGATVMYEVSVIPLVRICSARYV